MAWDGCKDKCHFSTLYTFGYEYVPQSEYAKHVLYASFRALYNIGYKMIVFCEISFQIKLVDINYV